MFLSIIVANYNKEHCLEKFFSSLSANDYPYVEIIFIDDCSIDKSVQIAKNYASTVVVNNLNQGPATCRNLAAKQAKGDILVFCDSDITVEPDCFKRIAEHFKTKKISALVGHLSLPPLSDNLLGNFWTIDLWETCYRSGVKTGPINGWSSTLGAVRKDLFHQIGGFNEIYKGADIEDHEFYLRIPENEIIYFDEQIPYHHLYDSHFIVLKKACKRSYQLAFLTFDLDKNPTFGLHRKIGYIISAALVFTCLLIVLYPTKIFFYGLLFLLMFRLFHHRFLFLKAFKHKGILLVFYSFFMGAFVAVMALLGFVMGNLVKRLGLQSAYSRVENGS